MGPKQSPKKRPKSSNTNIKTSLATDSIIIDSSSESVTPRNVKLTLIFKGTPSGSGEHQLIAYFNGLSLLSETWIPDVMIESDTISIFNLNDPDTQALIANTPIILILRGGSGGKGVKDPDPLAHPDNRAGASIDLFPLILGEQEVSVTAPLLSITTGERTDCSVILHAVSEGTVDNNLVPITLTMISAHCLPAVKDNTFYVSAIGLNAVHEPKAINFNLSLSTENAEKIVFASVSTAGYAANTAMNVHTEDKFIPNDLKCQHKETCRSAYWNAMRRLLVDPEQLYERLSSPFMIELAGVPRLGKIDTRGRYMGIVDARVLLEPGQMGVTVCSKLLQYNEANTLDNIGPLLQLPPSSAKSSARTVVVDGGVFDEYDHSAYAVIRFDLTESLVTKTKLEDLYKVIGFPPPNDSNVHEILSDSVHDDPVDARTIRKEGGALAVHKELSGLACKGMIPMTQGIKRTAANRLLMRVRAMLKSFPPGECSYLDYEDTVTGQHAASRRAVTASFAPQPPPPRLPEKIAAAKCRIAGDTRIAAINLETSLKVPENHVSALISMVLRCLEERSDDDAMTYLQEALGTLNTNRYLLWIFGGLQFDQGQECSDRAGAALRIAVKGDVSDGTANAIAWAALHTFHHCKGNVCAAFVAARKMRKAFSLPIDWDQIMKRWIETSGEEEVYWIPEVISTDNPLLIAAAFFLCLRCYRFTEKLLNCVEQDCASSGVGNEYVKCKNSMNYLRAASFVLRRHYSAAMKKIQEGIDEFGPTPELSQMRSTCLACMRNWDNECEESLVEAEHAGSVLCSSLLYSSALSELKVNPNSALQRAARAHKKNPSGHTALLIGRIYVALDKQWIAERWLAAAVNTEPLLADGWAMLALLAMYDRQLNKARAMLRTARQAGPVSPDIEKELKMVMEKVELDQLPDFLVDNLCLCDLND